MKRSILLLILLIIVSKVSAQDVKWKVIKNSTLYGSDYELEDITVKKDEFLTAKYDKTVIDSKNDTFIYVYYEGRKGDIDIDSVIPCNSKELFSESILSKKKIILPYYTFDILYKIDRTLLKEIFSFTFESLKGEWYTEQECYEYFIQHSNSRQLFVTNTIVELNAANEQKCWLFINNIEKIKNGYKTEGYINHGRKNNIFINIPTKGSHSLLILFDGDYINVYEDSKDKLLMTYVITDEKTLNEFNNLIITGNCDLSKVTWPRHADGTSPYDNLNKPAKFNFNILEQKSNNPSTTVTSPTNVAVNKTMTTNCNLKLRSGEATSTQVLTVMSAGTKVKILELGKAETIDGINSNWVKVEVQSGAKDRDGKGIKAGTVGWCYGGYLE